MIVVWYAALLSFAICGVIVLVALYVATWSLAIILALFVWAYRLARGQRGSQVWRRPFTPRLRAKIPRAIPQARYSARR
jgi:1,4-dihydroxy-2-naphthoate octaprenyltransferase